MDYERDVLLWYLGTVADNARYPPDLRDKATHIIVSFMRHRNAYRLLAQASELARGELVMYPFQQAGNIPRNIGLPVRRFSQNIRAITTAFGIIPTNADYEGQPIELISILDPAVEGNMNDNQKLQFHRALLVKERQANADLARCVQRYGYHYIFRAGLQQYYMTYVFLHIFILILLTGLAKISWRCSISGLRILAVMPIVFVFSASAMLPSRGVFDSTISRKRSSSERLAPCLMMRYASVSTSVLYCWAC
jgi:hypothetical protein